MNWTRFRHFLWIDTRFAFLSTLPKGARLLDLGSSNGETITHFWEARPDLVLYASDIAGTPETYPPGVVFHRANLTTDTLPWPAASMQGITCMHLVEHLDRFDHFFAEAYRLLAPGARLYIETPHPKTLRLSLPYPEMAGQFTYNFWDDLTHVQVMPVGKLAALAAPHGFEVCRVGTSRNWLFALLFPLSCFLPNKIFPLRQKTIARVHWLGWSSYIILRRPLEA